MEGKQKKNNKEIVHKIVDNMTLMDDDLMSKVFDGNIPATELLLRTILGRADIKVISVIGQKEFRNSLMSGRKIRIDIVAKDKTGAMSNIEVQRERKGAHPRRARFHSSMLDARMLRKGQDFAELRDSHTIFITEKDYFGDGLPVYSIERQVTENGKDFEDGSHIIYVNGEYDGDDALGKLIKDFKCKNASDMYYPELAQGVKYFKEEKGRDRMCEAVEKYAREYAADVLAEILADKEKAEADKEKAEADKEKLESENARLREELAKIKKIV